MLLDEVLLAYYHQHAKHVRAGTRIKYQLGYIQHFFNGQTVAEACTPDRLQQFGQYLLGRELKPSSANNVLTVLKAALNRAWKRGELDKQIFVPPVKAGHADPKGQPLSPAQIAALLNVAAPHMQAMIWLGIGTGARPEAVCELTWDRVDLEAGRIDLNPAGRAQTSKYRPVVKIAPALRAWLEAQPDKTGHVVKWRGKPVRRYFTSWENASRLAGVKATPYSLRHTVARWCRAQGVSVDEIGSLLGHRVPGGSITERYTSYSPEYQAHAVAAVEKLLQAVALQLRAAAHKIAA